MSTSARAAAPIFHLSGVKVVRAGRVILEIDSLTIHRGEHLVVLGPNGSGKSTLVGLLTGSVRPHAGAGCVRVLGQQRRTQEEWRKLVALVDTADTRNEFFNRANVWDVVRSGAFGTYGVIPLGQESEATDVKASELVAQFGLGGFERRDFSTLSTGEKKRALIARALMVDPVALVLDEPTNGLDVRGRGKFLGVIDHVIEEQRCTVVLVTHRHDEVRAGMKRVLRLDSGQVVHNSIHEMAKTDAIDAKDLLRRIRSSAVYNVAVKTPLIEAPILSQRAGCRVLLKREDLQPVRSFKLRGAYEKMAHFTPEQYGKGVVTASAGNHAQGVALAARELGTSALIVVPVPTPQIKRDAIVALGAELVVEGDDYDAACAHAYQLREQTGRVFVHPYDDPDVVVGQGTVGLEIAHSGEKIDAVYVCVGGGGLLAGVALAVKQLMPGVKVYGVETEDGNAMGEALKAGHPVTLPSVGLLADGAAVRRVGNLTFELCKEWCDGIVTVTNDELCAAIQDIFEDCRAIVEPAGALAYAGLKKAGHREGETAVALLSGANVNFDRLQYIVETARVGRSSEALFAITIPERPGAYRELCAAFGQRRITEFNYRYSDPARAVVFVGIGTSSVEDRHAVHKQIQDGGFEIVDLTEDEVARLHVRHLVGGPAVKPEKLYKIEMPESPGTLAKFLDRVAGPWNISLFHYRNHGADRGRALVGFQVAESDLSSFLTVMDGFGLDAIDVSHNPSTQLFLGS